MKKDIAVVVLNYIQFINIEPGINELIKKGYTVDFYCPVAESNEGYSEMFSDIRNILKSNNYNVYEEVQNNISYKVLLEPYYKLDIISDYVIKYRYDCITTKPSVSNEPKIYLKYDAILCSGNYDEKYLCVYSKPYKTANMKFINFKKKRKKHSKKILLYLPTYGDGSSIDDIIDKLDEIKEKYYIIAKIHHGTNFLKSEHNRIENLKNHVDELYDSHKDLKELLEIADVVLSDSSGAIFEAIYVDVPVAIFCDNVNKYRLGDFNTPQSELVDLGIIPYTNDKNHILDILNEALTPTIINKQKEWNKANFYHPKNMTRDFVDIIEYYLNDQVDKNYTAVHNILKKDYYNRLEEVYNLDQEKKVLNSKIKDLENLQANLKEEIVKYKNDNNKLQKDLDDCNKEINNIKTELNYYKNGKLYKIANKIYKVFKNY